MNKYVKKIKLFLLLILLVVINSNYVLAIEYDELPQRYNMAEHYNIKVENQGQEGNCWAFAAIETLETYLQIHGYGTFDFSENHLNYIESNLFSETEASRNINTSGHYSEFVEYVNKNLGPVSESDFPYYEDETNLIGKSYSQDELDGLLNVAPLAYVGDYIKFPGITKDELYNVYSEEERQAYLNSIKKHIVENGSLSTSIIAPSYFNNEFYNPDTYAAYFPYTNDPRFGERSHAVSIIGWDDNYSKDNFVDSNKPENNGAWIILNSWGTSFGDNGLYYISYEDVFVYSELNGIKEAVINKKDLTNTKTFKIKDNKLYNALKSELGSKIIEYNDNTQVLTVLNGILDQTVYLDLIDYGITDLSGIENFKNLINLNLSKNNISDISPLAALDKLDSINLSNNNIVSIPAEFSNKDLSVLYLNYNPITDFSSFSNINTVSNLELEGTNISESDLIYLKNKKIVNLNLAKTNIKDYTSLSTLNEDCAPTIIADFSLKYLNISYNEDVIYSSIPNVLSLNLSHTSVDDMKFSQIRNITNLRSLDISYTNIKDLNILSGITLSAINLSGNEDLENFNVLKNVGQIAYKDASINDVSIFNNFNSSQIDLNDNNINDYFDLLNLDFLRFLDLSNNNISNIFTKDGMVIWLDGNKIKPQDNYPDGIQSIQNQRYEETLYVDPSINNSFADVADLLSGFKNSGIKVSITNGTMDYENNIFRINNYDNDVVIKIDNGLSKGSTITYKLIKKPANLIYIYISSSDVRKTYVEGESFDKNGLKVYGVYDNNSVEEILDYTIEGGDNLQIGNNRITIYKNLLSDYFDVNVIDDEKVATLTFENVDVYNATLNKIKEIEEERRQYTYLYDHVDVLINKNDDNKTIQILNEDLKSIYNLNIVSDILINLDELRQFNGIRGLSIDAKNLSDISVLTYFKELLDANDQLSPYEKFLSVQIKNNTELTKIDNDIFWTLALENTNIIDLNNLISLLSLTYKGNSLPQIDELLDNLGIINIDVSSNVEDILKDNDNNYILPDLLKILKDKGLTIEATIIDQVRDEIYLYPFKKKKINIIEKDGKLLLDYNDIKNIDYEGKNQYIEINITDNNYIYNIFNFKYNIKYKLFKELELEDNNAIELEEGTIPDLSNLVVYKVYSNGTKERIYNFDYSKDYITNDINKITISYSEDGITSKIEIPVKVIKHTHEWSEWTIVKEPTTTETGLKERTCLKNANHKEVEVIDRIINNNPNTRDNIAMYIMLFGISLVSIILLNKLYKRCI